MAAAQPRTALVVMPHADDVSFFCGGLVARWADEGWRVVLVRVTNDDKDSVGLSKAETVARNAAELREAAQVLGVAEVIDLDYVTDELGDVSLVQLRGDIVRLIRELRPYACLSFDQYGVLHEDNQDHIVVAKAVDEAYWTAMFDKHYPEQLAEGLAPHGVFERWYLARRLQEVTHPVDIGATIARKVRAVLTHDTMVRHIVHQVLLQARTGGVNVPAVAAAADGNHAQLVELMVRAQAAETGARHGLEYAEEYRVVRFGGLEALIE